MVLRVFLLLVFSFCSSLSAYASEGKACLSCKNSPVTPSVQKLILTDAALQNLNSIDDQYFLNPELIEKIDLRKLAELIVKRLVDRCEPLRAAKATPTDADVMMLVPEKALASITAYGFKNQHETTTSKGDNHIEARLRGEMDHVMLGLPYSAKTRDLLPKYALQNFKSAKHGTFPFPSQYGSIVFKFKDAVKKRSTWSTRDSLLLRRAQSIFKTDAETEHMLPLRTNTADNNETCVEYCEAQIWGPLDLTDVDSIYVPQGQTITEDLKKLGIDIYTYSSQKNDNQVRVQYSNVLAYKAQQVAPPALSLNRSEVERRLSTTPSIAEKNILMSLKIQKMSDAELISNFRAKMQTAFEQKNYYADLFSEEGRMLAELAARSKSKESLKLFEEMLRHNVPQHLLSNFRVMALGAMMDEPLEKIRPYLLREIASSNNYQAAMYLALRHAKDPEIRKALLNTRVGTILLNRFENKFCEADK